MTTTQQPLIHITGRVKQDREFSLADLCEMDIVTTGKFLLTCGSGDPKGHINGCTGVLLSDLVNETDVIITEHNDTKKMFLIVSAEDGYSTVFSWQELFNSSNGEGIMVILEKEGTKVYEKSGKVDLFSANDFLSGPRYVKQLSKIEICMVGA